MDIEKQVGQQIEEYRKLAEEHKEIDIASLMVNALEQARREGVDRRKKRWAYLISVAAPPLGLFFAAYYAWSGKPDRKRVAINCVILTAVSLFLAWAIAQMFFASLGPDVTSQLQSINADDIQRLLQP